MTEAPERIWATTYHLTSTKGFWYNEPITPNRPENQGVEYVRADLARADLEAAVLAEREIRPLADGDPRGTVWIFPLTPLGADNFGVCIVVGIIITAVWQDSSARNCAEEHNVYDCEIQWVPVKGADE